MSLGYKIPFGWYIGIIVTLTAKESTSRWLTAILRLQKSQWETKNQLLMIPRLISSLEVTKSMRNLDCLFLFLINFLQIQIFHPFHPLIRIGKNLGRNVHPYGLFYSWYMYTALSDAFCGARIGHFDRKPNKWHHYMSIFEERWEILSEWWVIWRKLLNSEVFNNLDLPYENFARLPMMTSFQPQQAITERRAYLVISSWP